MANYFGKQGPKFILYKENGGQEISYELPSPQEISERNWKLVQIQKRDVNDILRTDSLKYKYECTMSWYPTDTDGTNTVITKMINIINWQDGDRKFIKYYPHKDSTLINFDVVVTQGSPYLFSKVPYDAFTITVTSKEYFSKLPNPDALVAVEIGNEIEIT